MTARETKTFSEPRLRAKMEREGVDLHLAMHFTRIEEVRACAMAEFFTDLDVHFHDDVLSAACDILAERRIENLVIGTEGVGLPLQRRPDHGAKADGELTFQLDHPVGAGQIGHTDLKELNHELTETYRGNDPLYQYHG